MANDSWLTEISTVITVKDQHLPVVLAYDASGSLQMATVVVPPRISTSRFPWKELVDNLACSVLIHKPGLLKEGTFVIVRHFELSGQADGIQFCRKELNVGTERPIVGEWIVDTLNNEYMCALIVRGDNGEPRLSVLSQFDAFGGNVPTSSMVS